jgi:hypothetical protein
MYERRGYREFDRIRDAAGVELICMAKTRPPSDSAPGR